MRLTLRTLLAWLDGVLPDHDQQQLGAKVSASVAATHLVERIRGVVGRTAIGAPKPDGRGLTEDPNSVAEYLDNTLPADQLEAFERICIESEVHLAEVAACHSLLAELSRDSTRAKKLYAEERERIHQRLLGLLSGLQDRAATEQAAGRRDETHESIEMARAIRQVMTATPSHDGNAVSGRALAPEPALQKPSLPRPPATRSSSAAWASAVVALVLLLTLAGVLTWSLLRGTWTGRGRRLPEVARAEEPQVVPPPADERAPMEAVPQPAEPPEPDQPAEAVVGGAAMADPQPAVEPPQPAVPDAGLAAQPTTVAMAAAPPAPAPAAVTAPPEPIPPDPSAAEEIGFVGGEGVLLHMAEDSGAAAGDAWSFFPVGSQLRQREDLLVPPSSQPELHLRGVTIRLLPKTRAVLSLDADGTPRIEVVFGHAVARASRADARLGITAAGMAGTVDGGLLNPVAIGVELDRALGADPTSTPPLVRSQVIASRGLAWRQTAAGGLPIEKPLEGIDTQGMLDAGMAIEWSSQTPERVAVARLPQVPAWIESGVRADLLEKSAAEALAGKISAAAPLARALREMASADKRVENRMLAAETLALIGAFDDLVEQLSTESPGKKLAGQKWTQLEAGSVPLALARGGNAAGRLYESFVNRGPHGKADMLWMLARGFSDEELATGADREIVEALEDQSLIVRRYAIKTLVDITRPSNADRNRYRPESLPESRREGVAWWRGQLEKGLIRRSPPADAGGAADGTPQAE